MLRAAWEDSSLNPPCGGHQRVTGGGLGWHRGAVEGGASCWRLGGSKPAVGVAAPATKGGGARAAGQHRGGEGK
jgi:hypothetical protein